MHRKACLVRTKPHMPHASRVVKSVGGVIIITLVVLHVSLVNQKVK